MEILTRTNPAESQEEICRNGLMRYALEYLLGIVEMKHTVDVQRCSQLESGLHILAERSDHTPTAGCLGGTETGEVAIIQTKGIANILPF